MSEMPSDPDYCPRHRDSNLATSTVPDPAFEPHSTYMFEDPKHDEENANTRQSLNMHVNDADGQYEFSSMDDATAENAGNQDAQFHRDFVNPFVFGQSDVFPSAASWQVGQISFALAGVSGQANVVNSRSASVLYQCGQITPPDDSTPKGFAMAPQPLRSSVSDQFASNAKSERARNAANQRHAKAKKARKDSGRKMESPEEEDAHVEDKREKYREKNRLAAAKCRAKKKTNTEDLEETARAATTRNNALRAEERHLRDLFSSLRDQALAHDTSQGCNCQALHSYNMHQAQKAVRGAAMGFHGRAIPSPPQRQIESVSPTTTTSSRTHSFSSARPQFGKHTACSQSLSHSAEYFPSTNEMDQSDFAFSQSSAAQNCAHHRLATADDKSSLPQYLQQSEDHQMAYG